MALKRCPFYGFRWPDRKSALIQVGGAECGLDFEGRGACKMEAAGWNVDFYRCEVAQAAQVVLGVAGHLVQFYPSEASSGIGLEAWTDLVMGYARR